MAGGRIDIEVVPDTRRFGSELDLSLRGALGTAGKIGASLGVALGAGAAFQKVISIGNDYTNTMNTMQSVSGATAAQMTAVGEKAKVLGEQIAGMSASDAAAAMTELAKGGFSVEQSMQAATGTLQLAAAAGVDAATAATIQSQALQAFGLNADYAAKAADVLANTANASSSEMTDVAQGLQQAGSVANQFGLTIEDTSAALGLLSNAGIQGSDAGTLIKSTLLALTDQGKPAQAAIEELGLTVYDAQGKFVGLSSLFGQLDEAAGSMTDEQYQAATATLFGSDAMRLAGIAAQQGAAGFDTMLAAVNRQGAAAEVAAAKTKGLPGAIDSVVASAETMAIELYQVIDGPLESFAKGAAEKITAITPKIVDGFQSVGDVLSPVADLVGKVAGAFLDLPAPVQAAAVALAAIKGFGVDDEVGSWVDSLKEKFQGFREEMEVQQSLAASSATEYDELGNAIEENAEPLSEFAAGLATLESRVPAIGRMGEAYRGVTTRAAELGTRQRELAASTSGLTSRFHAGVAAASRFGGVVGGTAMAAVSGLKSAAGAAVNALGGPWMLGIMAATTVISQLSKEAAKATEQQNAIKESAENVAIAQRDMAKAFQESKGAVSDSVMSALGSQIQTVRDESDKLSKTAPGSFAIFTAGAKDIKGWFSGVAEAGTDAYKAQEQLADQGSRVTASFNELKMSTEQIGTAVGGSESEFNSLVAALGKTAYGGGEAIAKVRGLRDEFLQAQATAANTTPGFFDLSHAVTVLADESASASDQINAMKTALDVLSGKPIAVSDAVQQYNATVRETAEATKTAWDAAQGWGAALIGSDGMVNTATANGDRLKTALDSIKDSTLTAAEAGAEMGPVWQKNEEQFRQLAEATGLTVDQVRGLSIAAGLVPERVEMLASLQGADTTEAQIAVISSMLQGIGQPVDIPVDALTEDAKNKILEVGGTVDTEIEGKPGIVRITAPNQAALDGIRAVQAARDALRDKVVTVTIDAVRTAAAQREFNSSGQQGPVAPVLEGRETGGRMPGFAGGGRMPNRPAVDDIFAVLPNGTPIAKVNGKEWVVNDEMSEKYDKELAMINAGTFPKLPGFAEGGRIAADRTHRALQAESGQEYQYGGVNSPSFDCSGYASFAYAHLMGLDPNTRWFTTESDFEALGFVRGLGGPADFNIGVHNGGGGQYSHMAMTLDGVNAESGSNGVRYGEGAAGADDPQFENHWHLPAPSFNPPGDGSSMGGGLTTKVTWTEKDKLDLDSAAVAVTQAKEDLEKTQAKFAEGKSSQADVDQATIKVQKAEQKVRELEYKRDNPEKKGPAPQAAELTTNYTDEELDERALVRAVEKANERRNEVYADPESTKSEKEDADDALQAAKNALNDPDRKKKDGSGSSGGSSGGSSIPDLVGGVVGSFISGQLEDALGVIGLDGDLGAVGAAVNFGKSLAEQQAEKQKNGEVKEPAKPSFSKEELAKQGPVTPGTEGWMDELLKTLTVPAVLRDMGGDLPHGMAALNLSGATEKVLTAAERTRYEQDQRDLAALRASSSAPGFDMGSLVSQLKDAAPADYSVHIGEIRGHDTKQVARAISGMQSRQAMRHTGRPF